MIRQVMMSGGGRKDVATVQVLLKDDYNDWDKIEFQYPLGTVVATAMPGDESVVFNIPFISSEISVTCKIYRQSGDVDTSSVQLKTSYVFRIGAGI